MKRLSMSIILALCPLLMLAQNGQKEKRVMLDDNTMLAYQVSGNDIKNGPIVIKDVQTNAVYLKGSYSNGKPSSKWYFYNSKNQLESYYNFDENRLLYVDTAYLRKINIVINSRDKDVVSGASIPTLLFPSTLFLKLIAKDIDIPQEHFNNNQSLPLTLKATVFPNGVAKYSVMYKYNNTIIEKDVFPNEKAMKILWIPAKYNNTAVPSIFAMETSLDAGKSVGGHRRFTWNY